MIDIIDCSADIGKHAKALFAAGVRTVIRYYCHSSGSSLPTKLLTRAEADALQQAGLSIAVVFQQRGGSGGHIEDLDAESGARDAGRALALSFEIGQPEGSAIYWAVDHDFSKASDLASIKAYFAAVNGVIGIQHKIGVYGSGKVCKAVADLVDYVWLAGATGWAGTTQALDAGEWTLFQMPSHLNMKSEIGGFMYDGNKINPSAGGNFGQWPPRDAGSDPGVTTGRPELDANFIAEIQRALNLYAAQYGFERLKTDGIIGPKTRAAIALTPLGDA